MYQISLDQALQSGKPTALLFATPGFCRTATCGPSLAVMEGLQKQFGAQMNFIHVEVYRYPFSDSFQKMQDLGNKAAQENRDLTPQEESTGYSAAMVAWHLQSEPWLFLIDRHGAIAGRFEGGITSEELTPTLQKLLNGQPLLTG